MIYLSCVRRKSELRPVCLKIFVRSVEKYFGIQSPVWWRGWAHYDVEIGSGETYKYYDRTYITTTIWLREVEFRDLGTLLSRHFSEI